MPKSPVWWLDDRDAPTNSPTLDSKKLNSVINLVGEYTIKDLQALKELRQKIEDLGISPEKVKQHSTACRLNCQ